MSFSFGAHSLDMLRGVHADLINVAMRAIAISDIDFGVIQGLRTVDEQEALVAAGKSQTRLSKHLIGHAIDVMAYVDGKGTWEAALYPEIALAMRAAAIDLNVPITWGGVWDRELAELTKDLLGEVAAYRARRNGKAFYDAGHFELHFDGLKTT